MKTVCVNASKSYCVHIGAGLLNQLGDYAADLKTPSKAVIIGDSNVYPLYGKTAENSLQQKGFQVIHYCFPAGEASKTLITYGSILNFLAENKVTRSDILIALGGGVTGDITGFVAATYLRGVSLIQVPTSLLAMVDSSVGGKTAVDLTSGKNLVGAFYQPDLVLCDTDTLSTLPENVFRDGCAEVIKYGILFDESLFSLLYEQALYFNREDVICRCVELKRDVVIADEFDTGLRQHLNLGHTIGHAIESGSNFFITHGQAVAIGMHIIAKASAKTGICSTETAVNIETILKKFLLPTNTTYTAEQLYCGALSDKKRFGQTVNLIVPQQIGHCKIYPIPVEELKAFIQAGL